MISSYRAVIHALCCILTIIISRYDDCCVTATNSLVVLGSRGYWLKSLYLSVCLCFCIFASRSLLLSSALLSVKSQQRRQELHRVLSWTQLERRVADCIHTTDRPTAALLYDVPGRWWATSNWRTAGSRDVDDEPWIKASCAARRKDIVFAPVAAARPSAR